MGWELGFDWVAKEVLFWVGILVGIWVGKNVLVEVRNKVVPRLMKDNFLLGFGLGDKLVRGLGGRVEILRFGCWLGEVGDGLGR